MISDHTLRKISLLMCIFGVVLLFFVSQVIEPKNISISDIDETMIGNNVIVEGVVNSISNKNNIAFLTVSDSKNKIKVVMFNTNIDASIGDTICVKGKIDKYEGELEIIANSIEIL